jgi:hypothetical protein
MPEMEQPCSTPDFFDFRVAEMPPYGVPAWPEVSLFKRPASHGGMAGSNKERTMNKKHGRLFGFAVIAIAAMVSFAGCSNGGDDDAPPPPAQWPEGFTYNGTAAGDESAWEASGDRTLKFYVSDGAAMLEIDGTGPEYKLTAIDATTPPTYKISGNMAGQWNAGNSFKAVLDGTGETLTVSDVEGDSSMSANDYAKDE